LDNASDPRSLIVVVPPSSDLPRPLGFANSAMKAPALPSRCKGVDETKSFEEDDAVRDSSLFPWITDSRIRSSVRSRACSPRQAVLKGVETANISDNGFETNTKRTAVDCGMLVVALKSFSSPKFGILSRLGRYRACKRPVRLITIRS